MRSILVVTVLLAAGAWIAVKQLPPSAAEAEPAPMTVRAQEVQSIAIDGRGLPLAELRAVLTTHQGDLLDAKHLDHDRAALEAELAAHGYLAARVEPPAVTFAPTGGAFVSYQITQGAMFHLRSVHVIGPTARDAGVVTITSGDDAIGSRIDRARQVLADNLARRGKPSKVAVALHTDLAAATVDVELSTK